MQIVERSRVNQHRRLLIWMGLWGIAGLLFAWMRDGEMVAWAFETDDFGLIASAVAVMAGSAVVPMFLVLILWFVWKDRARRKTRVYDR